MSKYTTEVRFICETLSGLDESVGYNNTNEVIEKARPLLFNFDYPIYDEAYRSVLETKIIRHFYTREIGEETIGLWKLRLETRLNEIMPFYNKLYKSELLEFNPLYNFSMEKSGSKNGKDEGSSNVNTSSENNTTSNNTSENVNQYSDTPQNGLTDVKSGKYLTNATVDNGTNKSTEKSNIAGNTSESNSLTSTEAYLEKVQGFQGVSGSDMLLKYRKTFLNIDVQVIEQLEDLFIQLW